jgi:hypothetical protein
MEGCLITPRRVLSITNGSSYLLWDDLWAGRVPTLDFPKLFCFAKKPSLSLSVARSKTNVGSLFNLSPARIFGLIS